MLRSSSDRAKEFTKVRLKRQVMIDFVSDFCCVLAAFGFLWTVSSCSPRALERSSHITRIRWAISLQGRERRAILIHDEGDALQRASPCHTVCADALQHLRACFDTCAREHTSRFVVSQRQSIKLST